MIVDRRTALPEAAVGRHPAFRPVRRYGRLHEDEARSKSRFDLRREFVARRSRPDRRHLDPQRRAPGHAGRRDADYPSRHTLRSVLGDADQPLDLTTGDDVAAYAAAIALDRDTPTILRIAGETVSVRGIADAMTSITGERYRTLKAGGSRRSA